MAKPTLFDYATWIVRHRKLPTVRRRRRWHAVWQFDRLVARLGANDVVIDAGANVGLITEQLARTGAQVHAFEPDPYCVDILNAKFRGMRNVNIHATALGTSAESITLYRHNEFAADPVRLSQGTSIFAGKRDMAAEPIATVRQTDIVGFLSSLPVRVSLMKLDVEGAEIPILERLLDTGVIDRIDWLFAETHERHIPELRLRTQQLQQRVTTDAYRQINLHWH